MPLQPSGDQGPHHQHAECPRRRQDEKVIRAATVTGIPGWPRRLSSCCHPAQLLPACCGGVGRDGEVQREPDTQAFWILQPRAPWAIKPGWDGLGEEASEPQQEAAPRWRARWPAGMQAGQGAWQRTGHGLDDVLEYFRWSRITGSC